MHYGIDESANIIIDYRVIALAIFCMQFNGLDILRQIDGMDINQPATVTSKPDINSTTTQQENLSPFQQQVLNYLRIIAQNSTESLNLQRSYYASQPSTPTESPSSNSAAVQPPTAQRSNIQQLTANPPLSIPDAIRAIKSYIRSYGDWYLIERICYERNLIRLVHSNDHSGFIEQLAFWHIDIRISKGSGKTPASKLDANHLSKGARSLNLSPTSRFPEWRTLSGMPVPDKKLNIVHRFLSFLSPSKD